MAEETKAQAGVAAIPEYPPSVLPTFFSDGVMNFNNSLEIAKFYFGRFDPALNGIGPMRTIPVAQAVLSLSAFLQTVAFFDTAVANLIKTGAITQEAWDLAKKSQQGTTFNG